jgi:hypothetical protein
VRPGPELLCFLQNGTPASQFAAVIKSLRTGKLTLQFHISPEIIAWIKKKEGDTVPLQ